MKDFFKWLGVDEKVGKIAVWVLIAIICTIIINMFLESIGAPYYKLTMDNLSKIDVNLFWDYIISSIITLLNFYSIVLLVFKVKEWKNIFKYSIIYLILNSIVVGQSNYAILQAFIIGYVIVFIYLYSGKKWKYMFYGIFAFAFDTFIQYIWYLYKARFIDFDVTGLNRFLLSIDYFVIIAIIILIKEIYINKKNKRREEDGNTRKLVMATNVQKRKNVSQSNCKKTS